MSKWKEITTADEWKQAWDHSGERPVLLLKHSTTCPVSANALKEFEEYLSKNPNADVDYLLVKVIESRPVSNQIAEDTGIKHESPQILFLKDKGAYWNASHWAVTVEHIDAVLS